MYLRASCTVASGGVRQPLGRMHIPDRPRRLFVGPLQPPSSDPFRHKHLPKYATRPTELPYTFCSNNILTSARLHVHRCNHVVSSRSLPRRPPQFSRSAADAIAANTSSMPKSPSARHVARSGSTVQSVTRRRLTTRCCRASKWFLCVRSAKRPSGKMHASSRTGMHETNTVMVERSLKEGQR